MVKLLTLNVNGIRQKRVRWSIFEDIKKRNIDICFLQETHIKDDDAKAWRRESPTKSRLYVGDHHSLKEKLF